MPTVDTTETSVTLTETYDAPRERLFEAFTDPDELERWQPSPDDGFDVEVHAFEAEPGGDVSVTHVNEAGRFDIEGTVDDVTRNERIEHTWQFVGELADDSEFDVPDAVTRITVEFSDVDGGTDNADGATEVVFVHENLDPEMVEETAQGWEWILGRLETAA